MRAPVVLLLALATTLAGCAAPGASVDAAATELATPGAPWTLVADGTLGWIVAVGTHVYVADTIVGARSHEQCPELSFVVPDGATALRVEVAAGVAPATVALSGPESVVYVTEPLEAPTFEEDAPAAGVWTLELKPMGVLVNEQRPVLVELQGEAGAAPAGLALQPDADCLA